MTQGEIRGTMGHDAAYELMSDKPSRWHEQEETGDAPTEKGLGPIQGRGVKWDRHAGETQWR